MPEPITSPDHLLEATQHVPMPIEHDQNGLKIKPKKRHTFKIIISILSLFIVGLLSLYFWYNSQLSAVGSDKAQLIKVSISANTTSTEIGKILQEKSIIKNSVAFNVYLRLSGNTSKLQAGTYRLSPSETTAQIVEHLVSGSIDQFSITFLPGGTLSDAKKVFKDAGYTDDEITTGLNNNYDSPLFANKPASADLEGYIYGETYKFNTGSSVTDILTRVFDEYYSNIKKSNLIDGFTKNGLNLYQAITLASIIQREVNSVADQKQVAQVFYLRLHSDMTLGSDVTYQYIADKTGVARDVNLDSPYNTRRYKGLPPGPISAPGLTALQAVAAPASGDYLFFLSGDDDVTYFAKTDTEHEVNIVNHCKSKCSIQ